MSGRVTCTTSAISALAIGALAILTLSACGGDGGTGPGGRASLDPAVVGPRADRMVALATQPVITAMLTQAGGGMIPSFQRNVAALGRVLAPSLGASLVRETRLAPLARPRATLPTTSLIPDTLLGKTLVPNSSGQFVVDPARTGAPSNGVRFVITNPGSPQELGYADFTDVIGASGEQTTVDVVAGGKVVVHNVTGATYTSSGATETATGYVSDGTDRADFSFTLTAATSPQERVTTVLTLTAPTIGVAVLDSSALFGITAKDQQVTRTTIGGTTIRMVTGTVTDPTFGFLPSDTTRVTVNGAPYATIVAGNAGVTYRAADGSALPQDAQDALASLQTLPLAALGVALAPTFVILWLLDVTGF